MREIKFRAKVVKDIQVSSEGFIPAGEWITWYPLAWVPGWTESIDKASVSQFTGLKDKNGVEICEGDIGLIGTNQYAVCWNGAGAFFDLAWENSTDMDTDFLLSDAVNGFPMFEVIGNRFEDPELLEVTS